MMLAGLEIEQILDRIEEAAYKYAIEFGGSARCLLKALQDHLDLGPHICLKGLTPFTCGIATGEGTCGAVLGGMFAVGLLFGNEDLNDHQAFKDSTLAGFKLVAEVQKEIGTTKCTEIQQERLGESFNLADPEQFRAFVKKGGQRECAVLVAKVARITADFIMNYQTQSGDCNADV